MVAGRTPWAAALPDAALCLSALYTTCHLFKDHRAAALGLSLLGLSAGVSAVPVSSLALESVREELQWAGAALSPALVSFDFLWLSEDRLTAHVVLACAALLAVLRDCCSQEGLVLLSRCLALCSLSCSLTVSLFTGSVAGILAGIALSSPALVAPTGPCGSPLNWLLRGSTVVGCLSTKRALTAYLLDLKQGLRVM
ncbi:hypothetical protein GN956_G10269 [Arapaima gigas]